MKIKKLILGIVFTSLSLALFSPTYAQTGNNGASGSLISACKEQKDINIKLFAVISLQVMMDAKNFDEDFFNGIKQYNKNCASITGKLEIVKTNDRIGYELRVYDKFGKLLDRSGLWGEANNSENANTGPKVRKDRKYPVKYGDLLGGIGNKPTDNRYADAYEVPAGEVPIVDYNPARGDYNLVVTVRDETLENKNKGTNTKYALMEFRIERLNGARIVSNNNWGYGAQRTAFDNAITKYEQERAYHTLYCIYYTGGSVGNSVYYWYAGGKAPPPELKKLMDDNDITILPPVKDCPGWMPVSLR